MRAAYADPPYLDPADEFDDLFPGSGAVQRAWESWRQAANPEQFALLANGVAAA